MSLARGRSPGGHPSAVPDGWRPIRQCPHCGGPHRTYRTWWECDRDSRRMRRKRDSTIEDDVRRRLRGW